MVVCLAGTDDSGDDKNQLLVVKVNGVIYAKRITGKCTDDDGEALLGQTNFQVSGAEPESALIIFVDEMYSKKIDCPADDDNICKIWAYPLDKRGRKSYKVRSLN